MPSVGQGGGPYVHSTFAGRLLAVVLRRHNYC